MITQRAPDSLAEYCVIPFLNMARRYVPAVSTRVEDTFKLYGWQPKRGVVVQTESTVPQGETK